MSRPVRALNPLGLATIVFFLGFWQLVVSTGLVQLEFLPAPTEIVPALLDLAVEGPLWAEFLHTLGVVALGSAISVGIGVVLGLAMGLVPGLAQYSMASVDFLRTIPIVALVPVAALIWGPTFTTELVLVVAGATWVMIVNTASGFRDVHPRLDDVAASFGLSRAAAVAKLMLPAMTPAILVGARLTIIVAMVAAILAESLTNPEGLGWGLISAQQALQAETMWAYAIFIGAFGYVLNVVLVQGVRRLTPGGALQARAVTA